MYFQGHTSTKDNLELYKVLVTHLAESTNKRLERDADANASGVIIDTSSWQEGASLDMLLHCIKAFRVDIVLVMGHDRLHSSLVSTLQDGSSSSGGGLSGVTVVKLPKSGGVMTRVSMLMFIFKLQFECR